MVELGDFIGQSHGEDSLGEQNPDNFVIQTVFIGGNKILKLTVDRRAGVATTHVNNVEGRQNYSGSTTDLYQQALDAIQDIADYTGRSILYKFQTPYEIMRRWAMDPEKGQKVVGSWDSIEITGGDFIDRYLLALKRIHPTSGS